MRLRRSSSVAPEREANDVAVAAVVGLDGAEDLVLDGVGAGLVERVAAGDGVLDFVIAVVAHHGRA